MHHGEVHMKENIDDFTLDHTYFPDAFLIAFIHNSLCCYFIADINPLLRTQNTHETKLYESIFSSILLKVRKVNSILGHV